MIPDDILYASIKPKKFCVVMLGLSCPDDEKCQTLCRKVRGLDGLSQEERDFIQESFALELA